MRITEDTPLPGTHDRGIADHRYQTSALFLNASKESLARLRYIPVGKIMSVQAIAVRGPAVIATGAFRDGGRFGGVILPRLVTRNAGVHPMNSDWCWDDLGRPYAELETWERHERLAWLAEPVRNINDVEGVKFFLAGCEIAATLCRDDVSEASNLMGEITALGLLIPQEHAARPWYKRTIDVLCGVAAMDGLPPLHLVRSESSLRLIAAEQLETARSISAEVAFAWSLLEHGPARRAAVQRAKTPLFAQFATHFRSPGALLHLRQDGSMRITGNSGVMEREVSISSGSVRDVSRTDTLRKASIDALGAACQDLASFATFLGKHPDRTDSLEAWSLLPTETAAQTHFAELRALISTAEARIGRTPFELSSLLSGLRPFVRSGTGLKRYQMVADALATAKIGIAPHPDLLTQGPRPEARVALYRYVAPAPSPLETTVAPAFALAIFAGLGVCAATLDTPGARADWHRLVGTLTQDETIQDALQAHFIWAADNGLSQTMMKRLASGRTSQERLAAAQHATAFAVAVTGGPPTASVINSLICIYKAMQIDPDSLHKDLHQLCAGGPPITVQTEREEALCVSLPQPGRVGHSSPPAGFELDEGRIATLLESTARIAGILSGVFANQDEPDGPEEEESIAPAVDRRFNGLDPAHARLADRLLGAPRWSEEAFQALAEECGLMPAGALETINEWAWNAHDDALLEEDDGYDVNPEIAAQIAAAA